MPLLHSLSLLPTPSSSSSSSLVFLPHPTHFIKFRTSYRENIRYLKTLHIISPDTKHNKLPLPDAADHLLSTVTFLKSKGFSDSDFQRLAFLSPHIFSTTFDTSDVTPVFDFLLNEVSASQEQSCGLILRCPDLLFSDVDYCLRPTLHFLMEVGVQKLNMPTNLNAHLLNIRVEKLGEKLAFLKSLGFTYDEALKMCERLPAIFGYSVEGNLRPKYEYLVYEMERSLKELNKFPQYFGFSLEKKIRPRHWHLKERGVRIPLNRMLLWSDQRFYAKWK